MEDFVAYSSRWRLALHSLGAAAFVVGGLWMGGAFGSPPDSSRRPAALLFAVGWFCVIFFGFCGVVIIKKMFDTSEQLRIGPAGIRWAQWSDETIPWSEIADVTTWSFKGQEAIILHLHHPDRFTGRGSAAMLAGANRMLTDGDISISLSGLNRSFDEAMSAIAQFRREATGRTARSKDECSADPGTNVR